MWWMGVCVCVCKLWWICVCAYADQSTPRTTPTPPKTHNTDKQSPTPAHSYASARFEPFTMLQLPIPEPTLRPVTLLFLPADQVGVWVPVCTYIHIHIHINTHATIPFPFSHSLPPHQKTNKSPTKGTPPPAARLRPGAPPRRDGGRRQACAAGAAAVTGAGEGGGRAGWCVHVFGGFAEETAFVKLVSQHA